MSMVNLLYGRPCVQIESLGEIPQMSSKIAFPQERLFCDQDTSFFTALTLALPLYSYYLTIEQNIKCLGVVLVIFAR
jgi:hypothetical protein